MEKIKFVKCGTLENFQENRDRGVYLFVFDGTPKRIIYVGTAMSGGGFWTRWNNHLNLFKCGGRTIFHLEKGKNDIYDLMTLEDYRQLNENVWLPSKLTIDGYKHLYDSNKIFDRIWKTRAAAYIAQIEVWAAKIEDDSNKLEKSKILESYLQDKVQKKYKITYYRKRGLDCWLGHREKFGNDLNKYYFNFILSSELKEVFADLED